MGKFKKVLTCAVSCVTMFSVLAVSASAATGSKSGSVDVGGETLTGTLYVGNQAATATSQIPAGQSGVNIEGYYFEKGTTDIKMVTSGGSAVGGNTATATISNNNGTWITVTSTHTGIFNGQSKSFTLSV